MADTLLEQTRALHEDIERTERLIVKDFKRDLKQHREKLMQSHRVKRRLENTEEAAQKLVKIYEDEDGARKEEIAALANKDNPFAAFYDRLKEIREYHRRFPNLDVTEAENDEPLLKEEPHVVFTGEEGLGRYLDLHSHYLALINAKFGKKDMEYYEYVANLATHTANIPRGFKAGTAYRGYLQDLLNYLADFHERTQPLFQLQKQLAKVEEETRAVFESGTLPGWEDRGAGTQASTTSTSASGIDLEAFDSPDELESIGPERLKEALSAMGLKCGGTPKERAQRLWLTRYTPLYMLDKKLFAKGVAPPAPAESALHQGESEQQQQQQQMGSGFAKRRAAALLAALLEAKLSKLCQLLTSVIADTKGKLEKKQAQTYEEMMAEQEEAGEEAGPPPEEGSEGEDEFIYNPLKLPLGWDGKPIPYWLYKLHGLNQEFKCEICGNYSYWGRRAYERHFKEWRHQNGMRAMGIPNNKNFFEVTKIDDAMALWRDIQFKQKGGFKADQDEEYEDAQGNVYNKRTFLDLKKQGLV